MDHCNTPNENIGGVKHPPGLRHFYVAVIEYLLFDTNKRPPGYIVLNLDSPCKSSLAEPQSIQAITSPHMEICDNTVLQSFGRDVALRV